MAGRFYQCSSEMKIAAFPVYKYMWENPLKLPPTFHIFLFGLASSDQGSDGRELGQAARVLPAPEAPTKATGWYRLSFAFTAVYT